MKNLVIKSVFFVGVGLLLLVGVSSLIDASDLRWSLCYDLSNNGNINQCNVFSSLLFPALFLILLSSVLYLFRFDYMSRKKKVLTIALAYPGFFTALFLFTQICNSATLCNMSENNVLGLILGIFFPLVPTLLFSLITYKMRDEVFEHWVKFAAWFVPVMIVLTFLILGGASNGGLGIKSSYSDSFDAFLFMILYGTFIGVSLYRVVSKYKQLKRTSVGKL